MPIKRQTEIITSMKEQYLLKEEEEDYSIIFKAYADDIVIKDRKYQAVAPSEVVAQLHHLNSEQKQQLQQVFEKS